jgi:uncharacterized protein YkwD
MSAMRWCAVLGVIGAAWMLSPASAESSLETAVLAELNDARADPAAYARKLETYRTYFHAKMVRMPGLKVDIETEEGVAAVDETIGFLARQAPLGRLDTAVLLRAAAADHVAEQSATGATGHDSDDGSEPADRVKRRGGGPYVAEVIAYGPIDAADVVRQLIVDDGVADRGHRTVLFSPELRYAGVSCGSHLAYRTMCVIDMGMTADGRLGGGGSATAAR